MDTQLWCPPRHYCLESHHHKHTSSVPDRSGATAPGRQQAESRQKEPLTYYFPQQNNILASHNKDASRDVPILLAHVDALHSLVQHQVCCSSQEREREKKKNLYFGVFSSYEERLIPARQKTQSSDSNDIFTPLSRSSEPDHRKHRPPPPWLKRGGCSNGCSTLGAAGQLPCHEAASACPAPAACAGRAASSDHRGPSPPKHNVPKTAEKTRAVGAGGSGQGPRHSLVSTDITLTCLRLFLPKKGCQGINAGYSQKGGEAPSSEKVSEKHQVRGGTRKQVFNPQHKHALKTRPAITSLCALLN